MFSQEYANGFMIGLMVSSVLFLIIILWIWTGRDKNYKYVPPLTARVIYKSEWEKVEQNIASEIVRAKSAGVRLGRKQVIDTLEEKLKEKKAPIESKRAYSVLSLKVGEEHLAEQQAEHLASHYLDVRNSTSDNEIRELCEVRINQLKKAVVAIENIRKATRTRGNI